MDETEKDGRALGAGTARGPRAPQTSERSWVASILWAALFIGVGIALSAIINPLLGRFVHWDWMAGIAPASFALFAWALRHRWV